MKIGTDIKKVIEDDIKHLTEAFLTCEISLPDSSQMSDLSYFSLASDIIRYQLQIRMLSLIIPFLGSMKWLTLAEACIYARKSRNTLLDLIKEGRIYGTKAEGGEWIIDRETIDAHYNEERLALQEKLRDLRRRTS
jgi:excisionase family DNA binding protein